MKKHIFAHKLLAGIACMQVFSTSPDGASLGTTFKPVPITKGSAADMPKSLAEAVRPLLDQGYYVMEWSAAPARTGYMVDLYHSNPERLGSHRDDVREAASRGLGFNMRKFISLPIR